MKQQWMHGCTSRHTTDILVFAVDKTSFSLIEQNMTILTIQDGYE